MQNERKKLEELNLLDDFLFNAVFGNKTVSNDLLVLPERF